jgi:hypothetical protein
MRRFVQVLLVGLVVAALSPSVQATVLWQHTGSADPTTEGFTVDSISHDGTGAAIDDGGVAAWNITGTSAMLRYNQPLGSTLTDMATQGWYVDWKVRSTLTTDWASKCHTYLEVTNSQKTYNVIVGPDSGDLYVYGADGGFGAYNQIYTAAGAATAWHTYRLAVDAGGNNNSPAHFYADGVYQTDISPLAFPYVPNGRFVWGNSGSAGGGLGDANWADVTFGLGAPPAVPEPSTLALSVTALLGLLAYAWRKRK